MLPYLTRTGSILVREYCERWSGISFRVEHLAFGIGSGVSIGCFTFTAIFFSLLSPFGQRLTLTRLRPIYGSEPGESANKGQRGEINR